MGLALHFFKVVGGHPVRSQFTCRKPPSILLLRRILGRHVWANCSGGSPEYYWWNFFSFPTSWGGCAMHLLWEISCGDLDLHCLCAAERGGIHKVATTLLGGLCMTQFLFRRNLLLLHIFYKPSHPGMRFWQRLWRCLSSGDSTKNAGRCGSVVGDRGTVHVHVELALPWDGHNCCLMVCWVFLWSRVSLSFLLLQTRLEATAYYHYYH